MLSMRFVLQVTFVLLFIGGIVFYDRFSSNNNNIITSSSSSSSSSSISNNDNINNVFKKTSNDDETPQESTRIKQQQQKQRKDKTMNLDSSSYSSLTPQQIQDKTINIFHQFFLSVAPPRYVAPPKSFQEYRKEILAGFEKVIGESFYVSSSKDDNDDDLVVDGDDDEISYLTVAQKNKKKKQKNKNLNSDSIEEEQHTNNDNNNNSQNQEVIAIVNYTRQIDCILKVRQLYFPYLNLDEILSSELVSLISSSSTKNSNKKFIDTTKNTDILDPNLRHQYFVVDSWILTIEQKNLQVHSKYLRSFAVCLKGGGIFGNPQSQDLWTQRGSGYVGAVAAKKNNKEQNTNNHKKSSVSSSSSAASMKNMQLEQHPFFNSLHGGVTPGRAITQGIRCAEYLGLDSQMYRYSSISPSSLKQQQQEQEEENHPHRKVILDLGCGHAALLAAMCPPHPNLWCYGVDYSKGLTEQAKRHFPHLSVEHGVLAHHIPTGAVDKVLSNAVLPMIQFSSGCDHLFEIIRLLKPNNKSVAIIFQPSLVMWGRYHPSYFVDDFDFFFRGGEKNKDEELIKNDFFPEWSEVDVSPTTSASTKQQQQQKNNKKKRFIHPLRVLSRCPGHLSKYIKRIDIIAEDQMVAIYRPRWTQKFAAPKTEDIRLKFAVESQNNTSTSGSASKKQFTFKPNAKYTNKLRGFGGTFGIRIFRNDIKFDSMNEPKFWKEKDSMKNQFAEKTNSEQIATTLEIPEGLKKCLSSERSLRLCRNFTTREFELASTCYHKKTKKHHWCQKEQEDLKADVGGVKRMFVSSS